MFKKSTMTSEGFKSQLVGMEKYKCRLIKVLSEAPSGSHSLQKIISSLTIYKVGPVLK